MPATLVLLRYHGGYGYELMKRLLDFGFESVNPGTLYRVLRKMETDGLCESKWDTASSGPARRMYSITIEGEAYLDLWVKSLEQYRMSMQAFFQVYRSGR